MHNKIKFQAVAVRRSWLALCTPRIDCCSSNSGDSGSRKSKTHFHEMRSSTTNLVDGIILLLIVKLHNELGCNKTWQILIMYVCITLRHSDAYEQFL